MKICGDIPCIELFARQEFDAVNENLPEMVEWYGNDSRKVHADCYIDDKCVNKPNYCVLYKEVAE